MRCTSVMMLVMSIAFCGPAMATIIRVPADFSTIQSGINASINGDTVLVERGTYIEPKLNFNGHLIMLASRFLLTQDTSDISATIITGTNEPDTLVTFNHDEDSTTKLTGFLITGGLIGVCVYDASPQIRNNIIDDNHNGTNGGGIFWHGGGMDISGNRIFNNTAPQGAAIWAEGCGGNIDHNLIFGNWASHGPGIFIDALSTVNIYNNTICNNFNGYHEPYGAIFIDYNGVGYNVSIYNNIIAFNDLGITNGMPYPTVDIDYNDIYANSQGDCDMCTPGPHSISLDPLFVGGDPFDYRLFSFSPCVDAGRPFGPQDPDSSRSDMGALWPPSSNYAFIAGAVVDILNFPLENAIVTVLNHGFCDTTDSNGNFLCGPVSSDQVYNLLIRRIGFKDTTLTGIALTPADTAILDTIILRADPRGADTIYVSGDINGDGDASPLADVVYGRNTFYGGPQPPELIYCTDHYSSAAADVNGNCIFNGLDLTFLVRYWEGGDNNLLHCETCPSPQSDTQFLPRGIDPGIPDTIVLGNLDGTPIMALPGDTISIPIWIKNDEAVAGLNISVAADTAYLIEWLDGIWQNPLTGWYNRTFLQPEIDNPAPGYTSQTLLGWRIMPSDSSYLNSYGDYRLLATLRAATNPNFSHPGDTTRVIPGENSRAGITAFCDSAGLTEWSPVVLGGRIFFTTDSAYIAVSRVDFMETVPPGSSLRRDLFITDYSLADLFYQANHDSSWIELSSSGGSAGTCEIDTITVTFHAETLTQGSYSARIDLVSNDPDRSDIILPVTLAVRVGCNYTLGDVAGNHVFNGLDVVYSVSYFKGGPPPTYSCACGSHGTFFVAGDVNQSCSFNGLDVTYMVAYFKGGPVPRPCPDCPPSGQ